MSPPGHQPGGSVGHGGSRCLSALLESRWDPPAHPSYLLTSLIRPAAVNLLHMILTNVHVCLVTEQLQYGQRTDVKMAVGQGTAHGGQERDRGLSCPGGRTLHLSALAPHLNPTYYLFYKCLKSWYGGIWSTTAAHQSNPPFSLLLSKSRSSSHLVSIPSKHSSSCLSRCFVSAVRCWAPPGYL